jgi:ABC-type multidrug transport system fused ATPase/permease subunit
VPPSLAVTDAPPERASSGDGQVLTDVSLRIEAGSFVALAGSSGSGKSTVAALASGLFVPTTGTITVGGVDIRALDDGTLKRSVGLVTQDTHLTHDSIRANLLLARPDATEKEMVKACVAAGIHKFIRGLPSGYGTVVGERGVRLSGGQRQRLAFARVLLMDPAIVILDEATAHLDTEAETLLREAVDKVLAGRTRLVIAHRLSTIVNADEILVMEDGRVIERGRHDDLMAAGGRYEQLYRGQFLHRPAGLTPAEPVDGAVPIAPLRP